MSGDFQKPIDRKDQPPIEQPPAISPIEKDKKEKEDSIGDAWREAASQPFILVSILSSIKKFISSFHLKRDFLFSLNEQKIAKHCQDFKHLFQQLAIEDISHEVKYLQELSKLWESLLEDYKLINPIEKKNSPALIKLEQFIDNISNFPPGEDHPLGYYFTKHVGQEWIPFPFMDILKNLHDAYQDNPQNNPLKKWIELLEAILFELCKKSFSEE